MRIKQLLAKLKPSKKATVALLAVVAIAVPATAWAAWGPGRPVWDWNDPNQHKGSLTGPVFNSFINTPTYGDERNLTSIAPAGTAAWKDSTNVEVGKEVDVRVFIHNNANESTNASGLGVAKNTKVELYLPEGVGSGFDIGGYISADNATPKRVYDTANVRSNNKNFEIQYVPGSAKIYNNGPWKNGVALSDDVVKTGGTPIGYNALNGDLPGCFQYSAVVIVRVKLVAPKIDFNKQVTVPGSTNWQKSMVVNPGDTDSWLLSFNNTGNTTLKKLVLKDAIPAGLTLVPGTITWFDTAHPNGQVLPDNALSGGGIDLGNYAAGGGGYVRFRTTVDREFDFNKVDCKITNVGKAYAEYVPEVSSSAYVRVDVNGNGNPDDDCKDKKVVSCDALTAQSLGNRSFRFNVTYTAQNATFKSATYTFGDNTAALVTDKTSVEHTYAADGTYNTKVVLTFTVDGKDQVVTSEACATTVNTETPPENCPIPGKENLPKDSPECVMPNTGAGDVVGIFAATTVAGTLVHKFVYGRRRDY